jgi:hypothetical protein
MDCDEELAEELEVIGHLEHMKEGKFRGRTCSYKIIL